VGLRAHGVDSKRHGACSETRLKHPRELGSHRQLITSIGVVDGLYELNRCVAPFPCLFASSLDFLAGVT
jgi:hypothetical protein